MMDSLLIKKLAEGNRNALKLLWETHSESILNLAFRFMKNREEAEDILMDVFVELPKNAAYFRGESQLSTWLYRMTVNACLMKFRKEKRHRELENENYDFIVSSALGSKIYSENEGQILLNALNLLNPETRSMVWLKDREGLDIKDLCEIFNKPEGTIKARLSRARSFLREVLTAQESTLHKTKKEFSYG